MANILDVLSEYGHACRCNYRQGDSVEDDMDAIVEFCRQYGYNFSDDKAKELRKELYLCPLKRGIFQNAYACNEYPHSIHRMRIGLKCRLITTNKEKKND